MHEWINNFDAGVAGLVFLSAFTLDGLGAYYIRKTTQGEAFKAAITSAAMVVISSIAFYAFITNPLYGGPEALGAGIASYLVIKADCRRTKVTK